MASKDHAAFVLLLLSFAFAAVAAIRVLKEGPMIGADGREYKSAALRFPAEHEPSTESFTGDSSVQVQCTDSSMVIRIKADLYQNGRRVSPKELSLGQSKHLMSSQCQSVAVSDAEYVIEAGLHDCGSRLTISKDSVIYSNNLMFSPSASYHGIARMDNAVVPVSCHYERNHFVSSNGQQQLLTVSTPAKYPGASSGFSLKLMTDDWTKEEVSNIFYLGDILHLEASHRAADPGRRRVFIDSCVATLTPDTTSVPRYYFIENHGCLVDAKEEGSNAKLQYGSRADTLRLQLDAFLFHKDPRNSIFITCQLKATTETWRSSATVKACNYVHSRWENVDMDDSACRCCESSCYTSSTRWNVRLNPGRLNHKDDAACGSVTLGPLTILPSK
ncbi:zona pellucida sperm-binding protein 3-like [Genypterus blacodes]|uniref:zona pellucida sperm-binding protein 3-like n=1 Tax=Genypterus blacodes TaxID=154954 RepID=UPI003F775EEF